MGWGRSWGLLAGFVLLLAPIVARADDEISPEARAHFRAGVAFLKDPDGERPEEAYAEFKVAYQLSKSPKVLGNLGLCAMKLERDGEAIEAFTRYAMEVSDIDEAERRQVNQDIATLKANTVKLTLKADRPQTSLLDARTPNRGAVTTNAYGPFDDQLEIVVRSGHHRIRAKAATGTGEAEWEFDALPGAVLTHEFHIASAPETKPIVPVTSPVPVASDATTPSGPRSRTGPIVTMAVGGTLLVAGAITGFAALRRINQLNDACPNDECPSNFDYERATSDSRPIVTATDILLLSGGLVTATGLVWYLLTPRGTEPSKKATTASATCSSNGCGAWVRFALP